MVDAERQRLVLYKYPQAEPPYNDLVATNRSRGKHDPEYELLDTGVFDGDRYFDVEVEYAKATPDDISPSHSCRCCSGGTGR
jgi:hypothetical protein